MCFAELLEGEDWISDIFFYSKGEDDFDQYDGTLPGNVNFGQSIEEVIRNVGAPFFTNHLTYPDVLFLKPGQKRTDLHYALDGLKCIFTFNDNSTLTRVTASRLRGEGDA